MNPEAASAIVLRWWSWRKTVMAASQRILYKRQALATFHDSDEAKRAISVINSVLMWVNVHLPDVPRLPRVPDYPLRERCVQMRRCLADLGVTAETDLFRWAIAQQRQFRASHGDTPARSTHYALMECALLIHDLEQLLDGSLNALPESRFPEVPLYWGDDEPEQNG